jgi:uncharacterized protein YbjT (DUF2867 family)
MNYLITGATGNIGSLVTERLIARGERPRILRPGQGQGEGALWRSRRYSRRRSGGRDDVAAGVCGRRYALPGQFRARTGGAGRPGGQDRVAAGVKHLVKLSSYDAREQNIGTGVWHAHGEAAIRASGIPFTFVQPSGIYGRTRSGGRDPSRPKASCVRPPGEGRIPFIHSDDIADVAFRALTAPEYIGVSLPMTGPVALSYAEMAG